MIGEAAAGEDWGHLNAYISDTIENEDSATSKVAARAFKNRTEDGQVVMGPEADDSIEAEGDEDEQPDVVALASGNLGLISFTKWPERMTKEQIDEAFPAVLPGLREHELVGFVMVHSEKDGPVVLGSQGTYYLQDDRVDGTKSTGRLWPKRGQPSAARDQLPKLPGHLGQQLLRF